MQFKKFNTDTVAELLEYLAENEAFDSIQGIKNINSEDVKDVFLELAQGLKDPLGGPAIKRQSTKSPEFSFNTSQVIEQLSAQEESALFKSFKIS